MLILEITGENPDVGSDKKKENKGKKERGRKKWEERRGVPEWSQRGPRGVPECRDHDKGHDQH